MLSAPLILGNDPRHMTSATLDILLAPEILALSQDALGKQARKVWGIYQGYIKMSMPHSCCLSANHRMS